jgi:hypothetical protein
MRFSILAWLFIVGSGDISERRLNGAFDGDPTLKKMDAIQSTVSLVTLHSRQISFTA